MVKSVWSCRSGACPPVGQLHNGSSVAMADQGILLGLLCHSPLWQSLTPDSGPHTAPWSLPTGQQISCSWHPLAQNFFLGKSSRGHSIEGAMATTFTPSRCPTCNGSRSIFRSRSACNRRLTCLAICSRRAQQSFTRAVIEKPPGEESGKSGGSGTSGTKACSCLKLYPFKHLSLAHCQEAHCSHS